MPMTSPRAAPRRHLANSPFNVPVIDTPVEQFAIHDRVTHDRYGLGSVIGIEADIAVLVDFDGQPVRITSPYPKLSKL